MKRLAFCSCIISCMIVLSWVASSFAWPVRSGKPDQNLFEAADLVIIATAQSTVDVPNLAYPNAKLDTWVSVNSLFRIDLIAKGEAETNQIQIEHYRFFDPKGGWILDGPSFVEFNPDSHKQYLIFLKRLENGFYEPVTGQREANASFMLVERYKDPNVPIE